MRNIFLSGWEKVIYWKDKIDKNTTDIIMGIGWHNTMPSILLPAYLLWGLDLLSSTSTNKMNIFIASNLSAKINNLADIQAQEIWIRTKLFLDSFIENFFSPLKERINIKIDTPDQRDQTLEKANQLLQIYWKQILNNLSDEIKKSIIDKKNKHSQSSESNDGEILLYPICHPIYEWMLDCKSSLIKIWGRGEALFNSISSELINLVKEEENDINILQITTKAGKVPLYYWMKDEPLIWDKIHEGFSTIKEKCAMREFDCDIINERIGEKKFIERHNDNKTLFN